MKSLHILILLLALTLVVDVDAGWKFWKKKKDDPTSTENPLSSTTAAPGSSSITPASAKISPTPTPKRGSVPASTPASANRGIAAAADPALAIGVGNIGGNIRQDARNQPRKPNPGTDVGLDIGQPKPVRPGVGGGTGQGYRDWAADLTGAGESGRISPKIPDKGPALSAGGQLPTQGNRPASVPGTPTGQMPAVAPGSRPASVPGTPTGQTPTAGKSATPTVTTPRSPTPAARPSTPAPQHTPSVVGAPQPNPQGYPALPNKPASPGGSSPYQPPKTGPAPASPTGTRTFAQVAGNGGNGGKQSPSPTHTGSAFDFPQPSNKPATQPGYKGISAGTAAVGGAAVAAGAATAANGKVYSSNPTYSKGNGVTNEDLEKLSEALFIKDVNNANKYITLNLQKTTSGSSPKDESPQPLLSVQPEALQIPTIQKVLSIYDNYKLDTRENEYISPAQRQEESQLVDTFLSTNVMSAAMRFLADKGFIKKDYYDYKDTLRGMWFNLYSRGDGKIGSTGFEHVFLTELKLGTEVSGLHNWIYFNAEEIKKRLDYLGYIKKVDLGNKAAIVKAHVRFNGIDKPVTNIFIGTSPELEMALYTVCFFTRPDALCPVSLGGTKFNIQTHKFRYRGRDLIGSAYPEI